jgi:hypothetical protein
MLTGTVGPAAVAQKLLWFASAGPQTFVFPLTDIKMRDPGGTMPVAKASAGQNIWPAVSAIVRLQKTAKREQRRSMGDLHALSGNTSRVVGATIGTVTDRAHYAIRRTGRPIRSEMANEEQTNHAAIHSERITFHE